MKVENTVSGGGHVPTYHIDKFTIHVWGHCLHADLCGALQLSGLLSIETRHTTLLKIGL